jgi:flagellar biogenesis protein FliO
MVGVMKTMCWWCVVTLFMALSVLTPREEVRGDDTQPRAWSAAASQSGPSVDSFSAQSSALRMVGGLLFCLGILGAGVHVYKRYVLPRSLSSQRRMQVVERLQLSPKSALVLVKLDGKEFVMTTGSENTRLVPLQSRNDDLFEETLSSVCGDVGEYNV